jgi:putative heme iron utilization protein
MPSFDTVLNAYQSLTETVSSVMLSTVNSDGAPHASYAPYIMDDAYRLYIFTSGLSAHTQNLLKRQQASVLIIEDEASCQQVFARQRITYDCQAEVIERHSAPWEDRANAFEQRFGEIIQMLRPLGDFQIFRLTPYAGRFIMGFGAAYEVNSADLSQLIPKALGPKPDQ